MPTRGFATYDVRNTAPVDPDIYYLAANGSDANNGKLVSTPWRTLQYGCNYLLDKVRFSGRTIKLKLADGVYPTGAFIMGNVGTGFLTIEGNPAAPSSVVITGPSPSWGSLDAVVCAGALQVEIQHLKITNTVPNGDALHVSQGAICYWNNVVFGSVNANHIDVDLNGSAIQDGPYSIVGGARGHYVASYGGNVLGGDSTVTITGTPSFSDFAYAELGGRIRAPGQTWTGAATGRRFTVNTNSSIVVGGSPTYFPGTIAGVEDTATFGKYS